MNKTIFRFSALLSGVLFGMGMAVSGMIDPAKVIGFLDISGSWDPSLAFVMGGALAVFMPSYFLIIKPRKQSVSGEAFCTPTNKNIDGRLLSGAGDLWFRLGFGRYLPWPCSCESGIRQREHCSVLPCDVSWISVRESDHYSP